MVSDSQLSFLAVLQRLAKKLFTRKTPDSTGKSFCFKLKASLRWRLRSWSFHIPPRLGISAFDRRSSHIDPRLTVGRREGYPILTLVTSSPRRSCPLWRAQLQASWCFLGVSFWVNAASLNAGSSGSDPRSLGAYASGHTSYLLTK